MRKLVNYLCALFFLTFLSGLVSAQEFKVSIASTDDYAGLLKPVKAGGSFQFQIKCKNNRADTCTVSIVKSVMGEVESWVAIDNNSQSLFPSQSKNFLLTVTVPSSAGDHDYTMFLSFNAYDKNGNNHSFDYNAQTIIVDNSVPNAPTFTVSQTSKTIFVNSWNSWDARSSTYTAWNSSSGIGGIKSYTVSIKNPDGTVKSISKNASDYNYHTFTSLAPNTNYKASVTAIDLAGNSKASEKAATTAPAAPFSLSFSNTTYTGTTLSWAASAGASGYNVYRVIGTTNTKLNSSPVTTTSYTIDNLSPNTSYTFNIIALSGVGPSDRSSNTSVTTLALPRITGSEYICSGGSPFSLENLASGYTVSWSSSSNIRKSSSSGLSAVFFSTGGGSGWVDATITSPSGQFLELDQKSVWAGKPRISSQVPLAYYSSGSYNTVCLYKTYKTNMTVSGAPYVTWSRIAASPSNTSWYQTGKDVSFYYWAINQTSVFRVSSSNTCGTTSYEYGFKCLSCDEDPCGPVYILGPNPATDKSTVIINIIAPCDGVLVTKSSGFDGYVAIYDIRGVLKKKESFTNYNNIELDLSGLENGPHYVEIYDGKTIQKKTLLIQ